MTAKTNNAEGGINGTTVTSANSGGASGSAFGAVLLGTGCTIVYDSTATHFMHGTLGYAITGSTTGSAKLQLTGFVGATFALRFYVRFPALVASSMTVCDIVNSASSVIATCMISGSGKINVQASGTTIGSGYTPTAGTWYRVEIQGTIGTTASNGSINLNVYSGDGTTSLYNATSAAANLGLSGSTALNLVNFGKNTAASTYVSTFYMDDIAFSDGTTTPIGPYTVVVPSTPPTAVFTVTATRERVVTVDGVASTAVGPATITGYDWNWGDGTGHGSSSGAAHAYSTDGTYTIILTVTDSNFMTGSMSFIVQVQAASAAGGANVGYVPSGYTVIGGLTMQKSLNDSASSGTYVQGPTNPSASAWKISLQGILYTAHKGLRVPIGIDLVGVVGTSSGTYSVALIEGTTQRSIITGLVPTVVDGSASPIALSVVDFPDIDCLAVTDWDNVFLQIVTTGS